MNSPAAIIIHKILFLSSLVFLDVLLGVDVIRDITLLMLV